MKKKKSKASRAKAPSAVPADKHHLLFPRKKTAALMNCSVSTLRRLEKMGTLRAVKPAGPTGKTYYSIDNIKRVTGVKEVA